MKLDLTVADVAALVEGTVEGAAGRRLAALRAPELACPQDLAVLFRDTAAPGRAGCLVVGATATLGASDERSLVRVTDPEAALDALTASRAPVDPGFGEGCHPTAVLAEDAQVDPSATLGPWVCVGAGARVGARCHLGPGVVLGARAVLGDDCVLGAHVVVGHDCELGRRVVVHPGTVIGADGFGFRQSGGRHVKSPQVGAVVVGDDVEIGAHCTLDRARLEATVIGAGCKLDDQVHVAHNCRLGEHCALAAQTALSGGVVLGRGVLMGGRAGASDGVTIGDGAVLGGATVAFQDVPAGAFMLGNPARPHRLYKREVLSLRRLPDLIAQERHGRPPRGS